MVLSKSDWVGRGTSSSQSEMEPSEPVVEEEGEVMIGWREVQDAGPRDGNFKIHSRRSPQNSPLDRHAPVDGCLFSGPTSAS